MLREQRRRRVEALVIAGVLAGFAWLVLRPHEPFYQGKPLSYWLNEASQAEVYEFDYSEPTAKAALRSLGTNALPILVEMAGTDWSFPREMVGHMARERKLAFLHLPQQFGRVEMAAWGFKVLGAEAKPAVPALIGLLGHKNEWVQVSAAACLGAMGPVAEEAAPALVATFRRHSGGRREDRKVREAVVEALGKLGPAARCAIPALAGVTNPPLTELVVLKLKGESLGPVFERLKDMSDANGWCETARDVTSLGTNAAPAIPYFLGALNHTNSHVRRMAVHALGLIHQEPERCVPALSALLTEKSGYAYEAVHALRHFGPAARPAVPQMLQLVPGYNNWLARQVTNAVAEIEPETAARLKAKAPVHDLSAAR